MATGATARLVRAAARPGPGRARPAAFQSVVDAVMVAAVTVAASAWALYRPTMSMDELALLIYPDLVNAGRLPNQDFFTPYGPGTFWPLAVVYEIAGGPSVQTERLVGLAYHVLLALAVAALCRRRGRWISVGAGALAGLLAGGLMLPAYGWLLGLAAVMWSVVAGQDRRWFTAGVLSAVACTARPELLAAVVAVAVTQWPRGRDLLRLASGFVVGLLPLLVHVTLVGGDLARNVLLDRLGQRTGLPFPPRTADLALAYAVLGLCVALLIYFAVSRRSRYEATLAALSVVILPQALQRADRVHLLFVAVVVVPLAAAGLCEAYRNRGTLELTGTFGAWACAGSCLLLVVSGAVLWAVAPRAVVLRIDERSMYVASEEIARDLRSITDAVVRETESGESMLIGTTDSSLPAVTPTYFYFLLPQYMPDAYYLELAPGMSERAGSRLIEDYRAAEVLVLSRFGREQSSAAFPFLEPGADIVNRYVRDHFCHRASVAEFVEIYRRC